MLNNKIINILLTILLFSAIFVNDIFLIKFETIIIILIIIYYKIKIKNKLELLNNKIKKVQNFNELKNFKIDKNIISLKEFNNFIDNYQTKIKELSFDKKLMNFQIELLKTFTITNEVVDNWINYLKQIFIKLNNLIKINLFYTILKIEDNKYEIIVLWKYKPENKLKKQIENNILLKFNDKNIVLVFKHKTVFNDNIILHDNFYIKNASINTCNTNFYKNDKKCLNGIIGIGFDNNDMLLNENEKIKHIMLENVLMILIHLIGSIKNINDYISNINTLATRDNLTNLLNRRVFYELAEIKLNTAKRHNSKFSLIFIDVDNFKIINDNYGHNAGDIFLKKLANILKNNVREEDIIVRYGGDEFIILLKEENINQSKIIIERIQNDLNNYKQNKKNNIPKEITLSIGIVEYPTHGKNIDELMLIADEMMYKSKKDGKNQVIVCNPLILNNLIKKNKLKRKLISEAINNYSLIPYFQKIVNLKTNKHNYELLMRIKLDNNVLKAKEFIEIAEKSGKIVDLDLQLFEKTLNYLHNKKYKNKLFVNISPKSLMSYNYINKLLLIVDKYNIKKENIVFEISEIEAIKNIVSLERLIKDLTKQKFKFAIDDFGRGFSSFMYIKKFKIDYLKINSNFIDNIKDKKDIVFIKSIIYMAKELNIKVIAEFIENKEMYELLKTLKVDYIQGYYIEKPKPFI